MINNDHYKIFFYTTTYTIVNKCLLNFKYNVFAISNFIRIFRNIRIILTYIIVITFLTI